VERELTGRLEELSELIYFKVLQKPDPGHRTGNRDGSPEMLGSDKSRGYCLEMICADFAAGANLDSGNPEILLHSMSRYYKFLPSEHQHLFLQAAQEQVRENHPRQTSCRQTRAFGI